MGAPEDDESLGRELRALARETPPAPPHFTDAVMQQVALRRRPRRAWWRALSRPREVTFRFRLSQLVALGAAAGLLALFAVRARPRPSHPPEIAIAPTSSTASPAPVRIRFALEARQARAVSLAGDFNDWRPEATPLERGPDGVWTVTVPLRPGSWAYSFVVDGKFVEDPLAEAWRDDGFGGKNAILRIGG